jgi:hypothetical protein
LWDKVRTGFLPSWLAQLQAHLSDALPEYLKNCETPATDLRMSQLWLNTMIDTLALPGHIPQQVIELQGSILVRPS